MRTVNHLEIQSTNKMKKVEFRLSSTASLIQSVIHSKLHWGGGKGWRPTLLTF